MLDVQNSDHIKTDRKLIASRFLCNVCEVRMCFYAGTGYDERGAGLRLKVGT
jgi:hypothetical protein